jgi:D-amino-acid dehydrogenase
MHIVIGAGIVGLNCAFWLARGGRQVTVIDRDPAGDKASFGNAGAIAVTDILPISSPGLAWRVPGWLFDPLGPLSIRVAHAPRLMPWMTRFLRAGRASEVERITALVAGLNARVHDDLAPVLSALKMAGELHRRGALSVYETEAGFQRDARDWDVRRKHSMQGEVVSGDRARDIEPALGPLVHKAVFTPAWAYVSDPKRVVDRLRDFLAASGVTFMTAEVKAIERGAQPAVRLADGKTLNASTLVVAAGAWSAHLARCIGDRALLESERGYNMTYPAQGMSLRQQLIFAERKFVATPLEIGLRIGGAAEFAGLTAPANYERSHALVRAARRYMPSLPEEGGIPWMGQRPSTPDSLPVIGPSPQSPQVIYAFGHGHLGLTQSATTGRLVADLVAGRLSAGDLAPFGIGRFA